jgi:hypothetical protein
MNIVTEQIIAWAAKIVVATKHPPIRHEKGRHASEKKADVLMMRWRLNETDSVHASMWSFFSHTTR